MAAAGVAVDIFGAGGAAVPALLDPEHAGIGAELDAGLEGLRPHRHRVFAHRVARAAAADAAAVAGGPAVIVLRDHARRHRPPVPAELVEGLGQLPRHAAQRQGRGRIVVLRRHGRIAGEAGCADDPVAALVVGGDILVGDRPVGGEAVLLALAEVGRAVARPERPVDVGRAAYPVPHQDLRGIGPDRKVVDVAADVDVGAPAGAALPLPVRAVVGVLARLDPPALLQADDLEAGLAQNHRGDRARGTRADDENVGRLMRGHASSPRARDPGHRPGARPRCGSNGRDCGAAGRARGRTAPARSPRGSGPPCRAGRGPGPRG